MKQNSPSEGKVRAERAPSGRSSVLGRALPAGFVLMSLVPILLALILLAEGSGGEGLDVLGGRGGLIFLLMLASAVSGFLFIRHELGRTFDAARRNSSEAIAAELSDLMREASSAEIERISEAFAATNQSIDERAGDVAAEHDRLRDGVARVAGSIRTARDLPHLYEGLVDGVREAVGGRTIYLMEVDGDAGDFVTAAASGEKEDAAKKLRIPLGDGLPGRAARERRPLLIPPGEEKESAGLTKPAEGILVVPMLRGENVTAVLLAEGRTDGQPLDEGDLAVAADLANLAAATAGHHDAARRQERAHEDTLRAFAQLIEVRDPYSRGHAVRVARYCELMARSLQMDDDTVRTLRQAALLHDIGKLWVPEDLLRKESRYTNEERLQVRKHVVAAEASLSRMPGLAALAPLVQAHHELADGTGYPRGLTGDAISLTAHILIVANAFDVMTSDRSYREAATLKTALEVLRSKSGKWYDRRAVQALLKLDEQVLKATDAEDADEAGEVHQGAAAVSIKH
ncbi:HD domain-containing protein [bacterium]|nr:HD domain-containing protein [bacterium]